MPFIAQQFPDYESFANATIQDILPMDNPSIRVIERQAVTLSHLAIHQGAAGWTSEALPYVLQWAPLKTTATLAMDAHPFPLLYCAGNLFDTEVETTRYDAGYGELIFYADGHWKRISHEVSGVLLNTNYRNAVAFDRGILLASADAPHMIFFEKSNAASKE